MMTRAIQIFVIIPLLLTMTMTLAQRQRQRQQEQPQPADQAIFFDVAQFLDNRGSFGVTVMPDTNAATIFPVSTGGLGVSNDNAQQPRQCNCVPYHSCDSESNVRSVDTNSNGQIELSFSNRDCGHFLDVCCGGETLTPESNSGNNGAPVQPQDPEPPVQQPPVQQPTQPSQPINPQTPPTNNQPNFPSYQNRGCGIRNDNGLDFSLSDVDPKYSGFGEFPWTVAIINRSTDVCDCAGSLIHPQVVLTAAHCLKQPFAQGTFKIRAGEWDTQTTKERLPYQERAVVQVIKHPKYNEKALFNDFALYVVDKPFTLDSHIGLVCLPPQNYVSRSKNCYAAGWGKDQFGQQGIYSVMLKKVPVPIVDFQTCQNHLQHTRLSQKFKLHSSFICAGGQEGIDTCEGDGGAPLACPFENSIDPQPRYVQMGIVAWGIGCKTQVPAVYANVASVREWIDNNMQQLGFDSSVYNV